MHIAIATTLSSTEAVLLRHGKCLSKLGGLLLLTPNKILKKTENRVLLSVSEWGPSTAGKDQKKRKLKKNQCYKKTREQ